MYASTEKEKEKEKEGSLQRVVCNVHLLTVPLSASVQRAGRGHTDTVQYETARASSTSVHRLYGGLLCSPRRPAETGRGGGEGSV